MNTARKIRTGQSESTIRTVSEVPARRLQLHKAIRMERKRMEEIYALLGWSDLPEELKSVVAADVKGYADELEGRYSTRCVYVQRRRESVDFWIRSYKDGLCTLETALESLQISGE